MGMTFADTQPRATLEIRSRPCPSSAAEFRMADLDFPDAGEEYEPVGSDSLHFRAFQADRTC
jgi:hypothetical protein